MKRLNYLYLIFLTTFVMGCHHSSKESRVSEDWPAMEAFHMVMAEAYHPYKDSSNLEPARKLAGVMATAAYQWANAPLPAQVDTPEMKTALDQLKVDAVGLSDQFNAGADSVVLGDALTSLHERFHKIMEAWHKSDQQEEHGKEHHE